LKSIKTIFSSKLLFFLNDLEITKCKCGLTTQAIKINWIYYKHKSNYNLASLKLLL
jgi:hypothetical protein